MAVIFTHGAGLVVHKKTMMACRITPDATGQQAEGLVELKECGTMTVDLLALSNWLTEAGMTHVAMESTGEYWKPIFNLLEGSVQVILVNAAHVEQVPGRKTDKADARWLAKLMRYGLLQASFIPPQGQREPRDLTWYRTKLVQERSREVNRVKGVLERANIMLAAVASHIMGVSGRAILAVLIEGRTAPATMAEVAKGRLWSKIPLLEQALTGLVRDHHRRMLAIQLAHIDFLDEQIEALSCEAIWKNCSASRSTPRAQRPPCISVPDMVISMSGPSIHPSTWSRNLTENRRDSLCPQSVPIVLTMPFLARKGPTSPEVLESAGSSILWMGSQTSSMGIPLMWSRSGSRSTANE